MKIHDVTSPNFFSRGVILSFYDRPICHLENGFRRTGYKTGRQTLDLDFELTSPSLLWIFPLSGGILHGNKPLTWEIVEPRIPGKPPFMSLFHVNPDTLFSRRFPRVFSRSVGGRRSVYTTTKVYRDLFSIRKSLVLFTIFTSQSLLPCLGM